MRKKGKWTLGRKAVTGIFLIAVVLTVLFVTVSYQMYAKVMDEQYRTLSMHVAETAAEVVDAGQVERYRDEIWEIYSRNPKPEFGNKEEEAAYFAQYEQVKDEGYEAMYKTLDKIKETNEVSSLYIVYMDPETMTCVYLIDADNSESGCPAGTWDIIYEQNYEAMKTPEKGFPAYITDTEEYGWLSTAGAAVLDENGQAVAHVMTDVSMNEVMEERHDYLLHLCLLFSIVTILVMFLCIKAVNRGVVRPINQLSEAAEAYVKDKKKQGNKITNLQKLDIHTGDEVEKLFNSIKQMEQEISSYIEELTAATAERERIGAELDVAKHIQASMLPGIFPAFPERGEFDIYASMTPAKEVGGDFYDFFFVDEDHLALVMADVSGKGIPAAMFMVIAKTLLKNAVRAGDAPARALEKVNRQLCEKNDAEMFVTVWLGVLELSSGKMLCANAGHEYPVIRRKEGIFELLKDRHGLVLAAMEEARYREYEVLLNPGDSIFVYTDGVTEAADSGNNLFGTERMLQALNEQPELSCRKLLEHLKEGIDRFAGEAPQFDDITMMVLKMAERNSMEFYPEPESIGPAEEFVEQFLLKAQISAKAVRKLNIAVDEIYSNLAYYSGAQRAVIMCSVKDGVITLIFRDNGKPYNPLEQAQPDVEAALEERTIGGLGIFIVKKTMDRVTYHRQDEWNVLTLQFQTGKEEKN